MKMLSKYEGMRPYRDSEIPAAMKRIAESEAFPFLASFTFPDRSLDEVKALLGRIRTCRDFQVEVMWYVNDQIKKRSISDFKVSGVNWLEKGRPYLFVSNHRDIMLDASLLQNVLYDNDMPTCQITFGSNLMSSQLVVDVGKANKMFRVERPGKLSMKAFYEKSLLLSNYIRDTLTVNGESVWIAQRNGRTKDGDDRTDQGLVRMLAMSAEGPGSLVDLNIVPIAISYEWEPCDFMKAWEVYLRMTHGDYVKKPGEDMESVLSGIRSFKGEVNLCICKPIMEEEVAKAWQSPKGMRARAVADIMDMRIHGAYVLTPNNFIAHDLLHGVRRWAGLEYDEGEEADFMAHLKHLADFKPENPELLKNIYLGIYAKPVDNHIPAIAQK